MTRKFRVRVTLALLAVAAMIAVGAWANNIYPPIVAYLAGLANGIIFQMDWSDE